MFSLEISSGDNDTVWGFSLVVIGLIYHLITHYLAELPIALKNIEIKKRNDEHDSKLFQEFETIFPENTFHQYIEFLLGDHSYTDSRSKIITAAIEFISSPRKQYLNNKLKSSATSFAQSLNELINFTTTYFFIFPKKQNNSDMRYCLTPWLNIDREWDGNPNAQEEYDKYTHELNEYINKTRKIYIEHRALVKLELAI